MLTTHVPGSPNFARLVYNASSGSAPPVTHQGNRYIEGLFTSYFDKHSLPYELDDFDGRSDYEGFIEVNIPGTCAYLCILVFTYVLEHACVYVCVRLCPYVSRGVAYPAHSLPSCFRWLSLSAGGICTGAEVVKTDAQRKTYGGMANAPFDPCYHKACDTVDNVNQLVFIEMARCAANAVESLALTPDLRSVMGRPKSF